MRAESAKSATTALASCFQRLRDVLEDFRHSAKVDTAKGLLERWMGAMDEEPMRGFIQSAAPEQAFLPWWKEKNGGQLRASGSSNIDWPADASTRVGLQLGLCRALVDGEVNLLAVLMHHYRGSTTQYTEMFARMASELLVPLLRDVGRLAEQRPMLAALTDLVRQRPRSADAHLDALLDEACAAFRDPAPQSHRRAVERLWDAWERAKTLRGSNKAVSADLMLDHAAAGNPEFRKELAVEARALNDIGNDFHIRHHETNRAALTEPAHIDYLFHRMLAMLTLVLR